MISTLTKKTWHVLERTIPFIKVSFSPQGLFSHAGRQLIWGKFRRIILSAHPPLALSLRKKHGLTGGCIGCGASCNLLFRCPHWNAENHLCRVYEDRPNVCKFFPITPADIRDRDLVKNGKECGFQFKSPLEQ